MEMDQISLQTLDRASIDIRRTLLHHLSRSLGLLIPLLLRAKAHTLAHTKGHDSTLRLSFIPPAPSPARLSHTSFLPFHPVQSTDVRLPSPAPKFTGHRSNPSGIRKISQSTSLSFSLSLSLSLSLLRFCSFLRTLSFRTCVTITRMEAFYEWGKDGWMDGWMDGWIFFALRIQDEPKFFFSRIGRSFHFFDRIVRNNRDYP